MNRLVAVAAKAALACALVIFAGCQKKVKYVEPKSNEGVSSVGEINPQDWEMAAEKMINSLLASKALPPASGEKKKVLMISSVRNETQQHVDTDLLVKKIRVALNKSGRVLTTTAVKTGGAEDTASADTRELRGSEEFDQDTVAGKGEMIAPDYSLSGKIIQENAQAGKTKQSAFMFHLSLTNVRTGLAEWEDETSIIKQGSKASVGW